MTTKPVPELMTGRQVADLLKVHPRTVRRWSTDGRLTRIRLGPRSIRYDAAEVQALVEDNSYRLGA
ncbi:helix-turn-helix transcriptional regulator [Corynebacterium hylobatis]|nr:helix-turn-helix domain-containing protein [Corynebacterium hylobatis]